MMFVWKLWADEKWLETESSHQNERPKSDPTMIAREYTAMSRMRAYGKYTTVQKGRKCGVIRACHCRPVIEVGFLFA